MKSIFHKLVAIFLRSMKILCETGKGTLTLIIINKILWQLKTLHLLY